VRERYGTTPVRNLEALGVLDQRMIANHVILVDPDEIQRIRECNPDCLIWVTTAGQMVLKSVVRDLSAITD